MRRALASPELIVVAVVAVVLAALSASSRLSSADVRLTAGADGSLTLSNSKEGSAILALDGMRPGDTVDGTLTIGNTGTVPGDLSLSTSNLVDTPGPGGGTLSDELDLVIADVTNAASPATVYTGTIAALMPSALGTLAPGASRTYEFRVSFPDAGPGAEDAYQGSSLSVQFDWTAINDGIDTDAPETTITLAPGTLVASGAASFSFGASEVGSSFECSLDRTPFAGCTSPAAFSGLGDGGHSFDVRATDEAGNADASPARHVWTVDATSPSATLNDPGAHLRGTVALTSATSDSGSGVASVSYQRSPSGAGSWTAIPAAWNTTVATDGLYDLRVVVADEAGNSTVSAPVPGRLVDNTAPTVPAAFKGLVRGGKLKLTWSGSTDASGVARYRIYANGSVVRTRGASRRSAKLGKFRTSDRRSFQVAAEDAAGNTSSRSRRLKVVPRVTRLQLGAAKKALAKRGFEIGTVTRRRSARVPRGVVIRGKAAGVRPAGSKIGLIVSGGSPSVPRTGF
ncbi:MAG: PASTA domain-containing protein, partial [Acidimicrobiia bacterium]